MSLQAYPSRCQQLGFRASPVPKFSSWRECDPYCIYVYILHFLISQRGEQDEAVGAFWICLNTGCFCSAVLWGWHRYVFMCIVYVHVLVLLLEIHVYAQPHAQFNTEPWSCGSLPSIGMLDLTHLLYAFTCVAYSLKSIRIHKINTDVGLKM